MSTSVNAEALSSMVYNTLVEKILSNELLPGELINRRGIAQELGISVAPVLEAIVLMENEGLLESLPRKGTRVSILRDCDITGSLLLRDALESTAARYYCGKVIKNALPDLLPLAEQVDRALPRSHEYFNLDREFHKALVALCRCAFLTLEHERITKLNLFHNTNRLITSSVAQERKSHLELLHLLCDAAPEEAYTIMHEHIISGKGRLAYTGVPDSDIPDDAGRIAHEKAAVSG